MLQRARSAHKNGVARFHERSRRDHLESRQTAPTHTAPFLQQMNPVPYRLSMRLCGAARYARPALVPTLPMMALNVALGRNAALTRSSAGW